jgi:hypothetical protein
MIKSIKYRLYLSLTIKRTELPTPTTQGRIKAKIRLEDWREAVRHISGKKKTYTFY